MENKTIELVLVSELSDSALETAHCEWIFESDMPSTYMEDAWDCLNGAFEFVTDNLGTRSITCDSIHGPGTERFFVHPWADILTNWGSPRDYSRIDTSDAYKHCDDESLAIDCANAWNRHVERLQHLSDKIQDLILLENDDLSDGMRYVPAFSYSWYESKCCEELEKALQDVVDVLNNYLDMSEDYSTSMEAFQEYIWECDDEQWYTTDGKLYALRSGSYFYSVDTCEDLEPVEEFSASHMIVTVA